MPGIFDTIVDPKIHALVRRESRGAHFRRDFPTPDTGAPITVRVRRGESGPAISTAPVAFTRLTPAGVVAPAMVEIGD